MLKRSFDSTTSFFPVSGFGSRFGTVSYTHLDVYKRQLCIFGGLATFLIYGGLMNPASVLTAQGQPTAEMFFLAYLQGIPFDLIHAASTVIFLLVIAKPMRCV